MQTVDLDSQKEWKKFFFLLVFYFPCFLINRSNHEQLFVTSNQSVKCTDGKDLLKPRVSRIIRDQTWNKVKKRKIYRETTCFFLYIQGEQNNFGKYTGISISS